MRRGDSGGWLGSLGLVGWVGLGMVAGLGWRAGASLAAEGTEASAASDAGAPAVVRPAAAPAESPGNVTLDFKDADINNVLRILALKSGVNIVAGKEVQGTVTIRLTDVPWEKALDVILRTYGFAYEREGNIIRVTTLESLEREELRTEVFPLNYANAKDVTGTVEDLLSDRGRVRFDSRTNLLIVTDVPSNVYQVGQVVQKLDAKTPQVSIQTLIVETTLDKDENLGFNWQFRASANAAKRPVTFPFEQESFSREYGPRGQTSSESTTTQTATGATSTATSTDFPAPFAFPFIDPEDFTFGTLDLTQLSGVIEMLKTRSNTEIKSNPTIVTLNNEPAEIVVGDILFIPTFERNEETGNFEITGYDERDIGIKLSVTPHVNPHGDIVVDLQPQISTFSGLQQFSSEVSTPLIGTREATTQVRVRDGQTIAIGGLVEETVVDFENRVPLLGHIPIIQWAFTKTDQRIDKTDLLFFLTVRLVKDDHVATSATGSPAPSW